MNAQRLLQYYECIADAPNAIGRLRRFILDLAVRGKLVPQASTWRDVLIEECLEPLSDGRFIHQGWSPQCESHPSPDRAVWGVLKTTAIQDGYFLQEQNKKLPEKLEPKSMLEVKAGDLLITCAGPRARCGITCLVEETRERLMISGKMYRFRANEQIILRDYLLLFLRSEEARAAINLMKTGSSESGLNLTKDRFRKLVIRLGALPEQHRIVAKVDELMMLCDRLEAARTTREATRDRLTATSLARLSVPNPETFRADARFVLDALPALTIRPDQIQQLRQNILNLAVRGKLVPQDPSDESAPELLKRISKEKKRLLGERDIKPDHSLPALHADDAPFPVSPGWQWIRTQELSLKISDGVHKKPNYVPEGIPFITVKNLTEGPSISFRETKFIAERDHLEFVKRTHPEKGDVLITKDGTIGVARVIQDDRIFSIFVSVALVKMVLPSIAPFLALCINSDAIRDTIIPKGAALKHLHLVDLRKLPLPLPPLAEQQRIVGKVDELMALCDRLESGLSTAADARRRLLDALLAEALEPSVRKEKAA